MRYGPISLELAQPQVSAAVSMPAYARRIAIAERAARAALANPRTAEEGNWLMTRVEVAYQQLQRMSNTLRVAAMAAADANKGDPIEADIREALDAKFSLDGFDWGNLFVVGAGIALAVLTFVVAWPVWIAAAGLLIATLASIDAVVSEISKVSPEVAQAVAQGASSAKWIGIAAVIGLGLWLWKGKGKRS